MSKIPSAGAKTCTTTSHRKKLDLLLFGPYSVVSLKTLNIAMYLEGSTESTLHFQLRLCFPVRGNCLEQEAKFLVGIRSF
ncbi:hypothetical protein Y032_0051g2118 [Ancylostoma ceylanicum]|uniref:Uncharacterized protein n=1 Tax=Ancylostoma ceylanicum TaxID=53326 RepID=A0A016U8L9_9BILA|nr:hypothetical protein Y032_0051g2118 [Ancylostoma ceylanicum]